MGCGFWGMSKGKAAAERVMLNIGAPPVALGLGDGVGQRKLATLPMCHPKGFHPFAFLYIDIGKLSHGRGRITRVGDNPLRGQFSGTGSSHVSARHVPNP